MTVGNFHAWSHQTALFGFQKVLRKDPKKKKDFLIFDLIIINMKENQI